MVLETVSSLGSALRTFSYSAMALGSLPCWTNFSAALRAFCLLKPKPNAIRLLTPAPGLFPARKHLREKVHRRVGHPTGHVCRSLRGMVFRTRVIVRRVTKNRMVTKGYRKGVYDRVKTRTRQLNRSSTSTRAETRFRRHHGRWGLGPKTIRFRHVYLLQDLRMAKQRRPCQRGFPQWCPTQPLLLRCGFL